MANVLILRSENVADGLVKSVFSKTVKLQNGDAVSLDTMSKDRGFIGAYEGVTPAEDKQVVLVYDAEIPFITDAKGNMLRGIVSDPRNVEFPTKHVVNAFIPTTGEEYAFTEIKGISDMKTWTKTPALAEYVVINAGDVKPTYATSKDDALVAMEILGKHYVTIGAERVPTIEVRCL